MPVKSVKVPSEYARGRKRAFYLDGFDFGEDMAPQWIGEGVLDEVAGGKWLGDVIGEWQSGYAQYADTIYYDRSVTEAELAAWEAGVSDGIYAGLAPEAARRGIELG